MFYIPEKARYCNDVNPKYNSPEDARKYGKGNFGSKICVVYPITENKHFDFFKKFYIINTEAKYN